MRPVDLFHIGPQKTATTWVYSCMQEHPEVCCPPKDSIHYYDMHYVRGLSWYGSHFTDCTNEQLLFDPTPSYLRSPLVPERMYEDNPNAKIIVCLRNPIDRAYSHFWHEKKKGTISFSFDEVMRNYDLYSSWIEPGFYARHLERFLTYYPRDRFYITRFEDLSNNPATFIQNIYSFAGINPDIRPSILDTKVNQAIPKELGGSRMRKVKRALYRSNLPRWALRPARVVHDVISNQLHPEYKEGISADLSASLLEMCMPEIQRTEELLQIDLSSWYKPGTRSVG